MAPRRLLLFTKTTGFRHTSLTQGIDLIVRAAGEDDLVVDHTEDSSVFTADNLERYDAVVWLQVSGDVLEPEQRTAFGAYLRAGGGFAGIHGAADAEWSWEEYENIAGARFLYHPQGPLQRQAPHVIVEASHPSTRHLPVDWRWADEWYAFKRNPREQATILLRIDESTYNPEDHPMGADHPVSWAGRFGSGRTWYTALGHYEDSYSDANFKAHLWGGITSVLRSL